MTQSHCALNDCGKESEGTEVGTRQNAERGGSVERHTIGQF